MLHQSDSISSQIIVCLPGSMRTDTNDEKYIILGFRLFSKITSLTDFKNNFRQTHYYTISVNSSAIFKTCRNNMINITIIVIATRRQRTAVLLSLVKETKHGFFWNFIYLKVSSGKCRNDFACNDIIIYLDCNYMEWYDYTAFFFNMLTHSVRRKCW